MEEPEDDATQMDQQDSQRSKRTHKGKQDRNTEYKHTALMRKINRSPDSDEAKFLALCKGRPDMAAERVAFLTHFQENGWDAHEQVLPKPLSACDTHPAPTPLRETQKHHTAHRSRNNIARQVGRD